MLAPAQTRQTAPTISQTIFELSRGTGNGSFPGIARADIITGLQQRIAAPYLIDQGRSSLCGPAAFLYSIAKHQPAAYAKYITDMYIRGESTIGTMKVKASETCRRYVPNGAIHPCDWVGLASLRDSENSLFHYANHENQFAGITMPSHLESWLRAAGFTSIFRDTNLVFDASLNNLIDAAHRHSTGATVFFFIGATLLTGNSKPYKGKSPADHWVVLNSPVMIDNQAVTPSLKNIDTTSILDKTIKFDVYTWGRNRYPIDSARPSLTVKEFLDFYYGYVSGVA